MTVSANQRGEPTSYNADGNPVQVSEPGGITLTDSYNTMQELTGQSGTLAVLAAIAVAAARTAIATQSGEGFLRHRRWHSRSRFVW